MVPVTGLEYTKGYDFLRNHSPFLLAGFILSDLWSGN